MLLFQFVRGWVKFTVLFNKVVIVKCDLHHCSQTLFEAHTTWGLFRECLFCYAKWLGSSHCWDSKWVDYTDGSIYKHWVHKSSAKCSSLDSKSLITSFPLNINFEPSFSKANLRIKSQIFDPNLYSAEAESKFNLEPHE